MLTRYEDRELSDSEVLCPQRLPDDVLPAQHRPTLELVPLVDALPQRHAALGADRDLTVAVGLLDLGVGHADDEVLDEVGVAETLVHGHLVDLAAREHLRRNPGRRRLEIWFSYWRKMRFPNANSTFATGFLGKTWPDFLNNRPSYVQRLQLFRGFQ